MPTMHLPLLHHECKLAHLLHKFIDGWSGGAVDCPSLLCVCSEAMDTLRILPGCTNQSGLGMLWSAKQS